MVLLTKRFVFLSLLICYMVFIWMQSSYFNPEAMSSTLSTHINMKLILILGVSLELAHLFQFGVVYLLVIMFFLSFGELSKWMDAVALMFAFMYGLIDEIHQLYVPYRSASLLDLIKNCIGIFGAWWFTRKFYFSGQNNRIGRMLRWVTQSTKT